MDYDLKITGGLLYDGGGGDPFKGDIAVKDGIIVALGAADGEAARTIDAEGLIVTPGFIDPHVHYDAQALWDSHLETSTRHGVTTAFAGNCGVGFAPVGPEGRDALISLMAGIEDIPKTVLLEGLKWDWTTFADYLNRLEEVPRSINLAANVTHDCVRLFVMGERGARGEAATDDDIAQMQAIVREALLDGAYGFSFGRVFGHRNAEGDLAPSYHAEPKELIAISEVLKDLPYRVLQGVSDGRHAEGPDAFDGELSIVERMVAAANRPVSLNLHQRSAPLHATGVWRQLMAKTEGPAGDNLRFQVNAKMVGGFYGLTSSLNLLAPFPAYRAIAHRPLAERLTILRDPAFRETLLAETPVAMEGDPPGMAGVLRALANFETFAKGLFPLEKVPDYEPPRESSVGARAQALGVPALALAYDLCLQDEGEMLMECPAMNYVDGNLHNLREMLDHPQSFFGVGDAGAHLGYVCDVGYTTIAMGFWGRDRTVGDTFALPRVVNMLTGKIADHLGLKDRGRLRVGMRADINVIDFEQLELYRPRPVTDLPAGGARYLQDARGYVAVLVNGVPVLENDTPTYATPGRLLRAPV